MDASPKSWNTKKIKPEIKGLAKPTNESFGHAQKPN